MKPKYFSENAYSIYPEAIQSSVTSTYKVETPETSFEWKVFSLFYQGKKHLFHEEYSLAFDSFKELSYLILTTVHPKLPANPSANYYSDLPYMAELLDPMLLRSVEILRDTPVEQYNFPTKIVDKNKTLSSDVAGKLKGILQGVLTVTSYHANVTDFVDYAEYSRWYT